jgi:hypothetical protein
LDPGWTKIGILDEHPKSATLLRSPTHQTNLITRSATGLLNLRQQAARLEVRRNFFSIRVVEVWNKIPSTIKMANSVTSFKNRYKKHRADMVVPYPPKL